MKLLDIKAIAYLISKGYSQRELEQLTIGDIIKIYKEEKWLTTLNKP